MDQEWTWTGSGPELDNTPNQGSRIEYLIQAEGQNKKKTSRLRCRNSRDPHNGNL